MPAMPHPVYSRLKFTQNVYLQKQFLLYHAFVETEPIAPKTIFQK
ncbi:hypothetical protein [Rossellomorea sp. LJF3]